MGSRFNIGYFKDRDFIIPFALALLFVAQLLQFNQYIYLGLIVTLVIAMQLQPLASKFAQNLVFLCFPVIGAIANIHDRCLTYNSTVLFLWCSGFAIYGKILPRYVLGFFLIIASWLYKYDPSQSILYSGAIMHGFMHPISFFLFTRKSKWIRLGVFVVPVLWGLNNLLLYKQFFVAFWDLEIFSVYLLWTLGFNKESVVKKVFLFSLPLITFAQMYWDICPKKGRLVELLLAFFHAHFG